MCKLQAETNSFKMQVRKRPVNFDELVLKELCGRMDPATRLVAPNWRTVASDLGVCVMTVANAVRRLKANGLVTTVTLAPALAASSKRYFINESVDPVWAASVMPQFAKPQIAAPKRRYRHTKAEMDAAADERLAERARLVMEDFAARMDPVTHAVAPRVGDIVERIGNGMSLSGYERVVRALKAAGLVAVSRVRIASAGTPCDYSFIVNTAALEGIDYLEFARTYRLKAAKTATDAKNVTTAREALGERILAYLRERMSPDTRLVKVRQAELGDALGYSQGTVSSAISALVASRRLAKVVGKERRGMGDNSNVYRIIAPATPAGGSQFIATATPTGGSQFTATATPTGRSQFIAPATPTGGSQFTATAAPPVLASLSIDNFKTNDNRDISFDRIAVVNGKSNADRTRFFDALRVLHDIAHGCDASSFPAFWFSSDFPTTLSVSLNTPRHGKLTYSVTLQRIDDRRIRVMSELLASVSETLLVRRKHAYTLAATGEKRGIATSSFALFDAAVTIGDESPVAEFTRCLAGIWLLNPDPNAMRSEIGGPAVTARTCDFAAFATFFVAQLANSDIASAINAALHRLCPDFAGCTVERAGNGTQYLAVHHRSDLDPKGTPFAFIDNAEKILFIIAFISAMNNPSAPISVAWLSPFSWLSDHDRHAANHLLRTSFSSRGQLIILV